MVVGVLTGAPGLGGIMRSKVRAAIVVAFACAITLVLGTSVAAAATPGYTTLSPMAGPAGAASTAGAPLVGPGVQAWTTSVAPAVAPSAEAALTIDGGYYWVGDYLVVDGWVTNDTAADVGVIIVHFKVTTLEGTVLQDVVAPAHAYNVKPAETATFKGVFSQPGYSGQELIVEVAASGYQPAQYPQAVELTSLGGTFVTDADGARAWTLQFRNDSPYPVRGPIVGGFELDEVGDVIGTVFGFDEQAVVQPGATLEIEVYGTRAALTPADASVYCQALPYYLEPVFRFYNVKTSTHFYTPSIEERDRVIAQLGASFQFEGIAYYTNLFNNNQPLYRFFYRRGGTHFYTANRSEADMVITKWPDVFNYEGTTYQVCAAQVANSLPVYRFINRRNGCHFYTVDAAEADRVKASLSAVYGYEGVGFWVGQ